jgi:phosphotriesterase-related protein
VTGTVVTVAGEIPSDQLGVTLVHEHLYSDMTALLSVHGYTADEESEFDAAEARWNPGAYPENYRLTDVELTIRELAHVVRSGCFTIVDATPLGLCREPERLLEISQRTGLNVVMGCGYYLEQTHPPTVAERTADQLAAELIAEFEEGEIRPGVIGEIGTGPVWSAEEEKVLRAAAWAQRETGLALTIHLHPWSQQGLRVLDLLDAEEVAPSKTILNHLTTAVADEGYQLALLERGVFLAYDLFGFDHSLLGLGRYPPSDYDVARTIASLVERGNLKQLLVSQDVGVRTRLRAFGGWGYAHLLEHVIPLLRQLGLDDQDCTTLLVDNPRRVLELTD